MQISGIKNFTGIDYKNKQYAYSQWHVPLAFQLQKDTFSRSESASVISFTSKQEQISRDPLIKLYKEHLNCLCCGREMIDPKVITTMEDNGIFKCPAKDAVKILEIYEPNMHTIEKEVFNLLKEASEMQPDKNLKELLVDLKQTHEKPLLQKQFGIFKLIDRAALKLKPELHKEIRTLLLESAEKIKEGNNSFSRKRFIAQLEKTLQTYPNTANKEKLIRLAGKLPTAYDDVDAFIVKYANPKYKPESIAIRLLTYSMATIEHIHPQDKKGANHLHNYVPECMRCNSFRSNNAMIYQLEDYPEMFINAQNLYDRLIDFANRGKLSKLYIIKLQKALYQESEGMLDLDYSNLNMTDALKKEALKPFEYPVNPDKPDAPTIKPPTFPKPVNFFAKPEPEPEQLPAALPSRPKDKSVQSTGSCIIISKRKRKRMVAEESNPNIKEKATSKSKKTKTENKATVRKGNGKK